MNTLGVCTAVQGVYNFLFINGNESMSTYVIKNYFQVG